MNPNAERAPIAGTLLASKPAKEGRGRFAASMTSVVVHGLVIVGVAWATMSAGQQVQEVVTVLIPIAEEPDIPPPPPAACGCRTR